MALAPLATTADLPSDLPGGDGADAPRALRVASAAIRDAAGVPISVHTATVRVAAPSGRFLRLPGPVTAVESVSLNGTTVTDHDWDTDGLYRRQGWGHDPLPVTITYTFGLAEVPDDIVDMTCQLAVAWLAHQAEGGGSTAGLKSARLDDAAEGYTDEAAGQVSPVFIPAVTRDWLRARFSTVGVTVVELS